MKTLLVILATVISSTGGLCQSIVKDRIMVNDLTVGNQYDNKSLIEKLGNYSRLVPPQETDAHDNTFIFEYDGDCFIMVNSELYGFELNTPNFAVNNYIRVGDSIEKVMQLGGIIRKVNNAQVKVVSWRPSDKGIYAWLSVDFYYDTNNRITFISSIIHDL